MMVRMYEGPVAKMDVDGDAVVVNVLDPVREVLRRYFPYLKAKLEDGEQGVMRVKWALAQVEQGHAWLLRAVLLTLERLSACGSKVVVVGEVAQLPEGMQAMLRERWPQG
jgi:hypothetical protein